jgi:hypothetical protein
VFRRLVGGQGEQIDDAAGVKRVVLRPQVAQAILGRYVVERDLPAARHVGELPPRQGQLPLVGRPGNRLQVRSRGKVEHDLEHPGGQIQHPQLDGRAGHLVRVERVGVEGGGPHPLVRPRIDLQIERRFAQVDGRAGGRDRRSRRCSGGRDRRRELHDQQLVPPR